MTAAGFDLGPRPSSPAHARAAALDAADPLARFAARFHDDDPETLYLDGNSLGRLPLATIDELARVTRHEWGDRLIRSWNERWWALPAALGDRVAPLIGAAPGEVVLSDSTSVNLHKLAGAALAARPGRSTVVTDDLNFPADVHVLDGVARAAGAHVEVVTSDGVEGPVDALFDAMSTDTALVSLSATTFRSGYTYDIAAVTARAHAAGALVLWDLSHAVGAVEIDLGAAGADLAVGCTYKYLNGGPGAPAFLYVRSDLQDRLVNPITSWWSHQDPFGFDLRHRPAAGIRRFQTGTMPMLSLSAAGVGIELVAEAGMGPIAAKARRLVAFAEDLWAERLRPLDFGWASPADPNRRGAHAALSHPQAWPITQALIDIGRVVPDFRAPDVVRLGLAPLTTSFASVALAVERLVEIVERGLYLGYPQDRTEVT